MLTAGIQDISQALVDDAARSPDLLRVIAEIVYPALGARRVLVCLRESTMLSAHWFRQHFDAQSFIVLPLRLILPAASL